MAHLLEPSPCRIARPEPQALGGMKGSPDLSSPTFMGKSWVLDLITYTHIPTLLLIVV